MVLADTESSALVVTAPALAAALMPLEAKGLRIVGLKASHGKEGMSVALAVRGVGAVGACHRVGLSLGERCVRAADTLDEALELLCAYFSDALLTDTDLRDLAGCAHPLRAPAQTGLTLDLGELLASEPGSPTAQLFCRALRVEGYLHVRCPPHTIAVLRRLEELCGAWYKLASEEKERDISEYGHVDRKFTGYRQGRYREQLEVRAARWRAPRLPAFQTTACCALRARSVSACLLPFLAQPNVLPWLRPQVRLEAKGGVLPAPSLIVGLSEALEDTLRLLEAHGRALLRLVAHDLGVEAEWLHSLLDPPLEGDMGSRVSQPADHSSGGGGEDGAAQAPSLRHSLVRACRYVQGVRGVGGSTVLCDEHTDVGFLTLDPHANRPGLEVRRRADGLWAAVEDEDERSCERMAVMVGDTLERVTAAYYKATPHRVHAPKTGERIGLPFLLRGRSDAVIDTRAPRAEAEAAGRTVHLARMESTVIKELPAMEAAQSILHSWFRSSKAS